MDHNSNKRYQEISSEDNIAIKKANIKVIVQEPKEVQENLIPAELFDPKEDLEDQ